MVKLELDIHGIPNMEFVQFAQDGFALQEQQTFHQHFGMFHFFNGAVFNDIMELFIAPVLAHDRMEHVLADGSQFLLEKVIQKGNNPVVSFHRSYLHW